MEIKVLRNIMGANEQIADKNRELMERNGVFSINIMSSPGAGKTSLILRTIRSLKDKTGIGVIEGDISSSIDAELISREGVPAVQINTGGACHLDANMLNNALENMQLQDIDLLFIENVGNLVCPAEFTLGASRKVLVSSVPEGHDKQLKYPLMFTEVDVVVLNKIDLLPYVDFDIEAFSKAVRGINEKADVIRVSCTTGEGIEGWLSWLQKIAAK